MPREHVDAIANLSNSRGASACVYGIAVLAVLLVGDRGGFGVGPAVENRFLGQLHLEPYPSYPTLSCIHIHFVLLAASVDTDIGGWREMHKLIGGPQHWGRHLDSSRTIGLPLPAPLAFWFRRTGAVLWNFTRNCQRLAAGG